MYEYVMNLKIEFCKTKITKNSNDISKGGWKETLGECKKIQIRGDELGVFMQGGGVVEEVVGNNLAVFAFFTLQPPSMET